MACGGEDNDMCKQTNAKRLEYCNESICKKKFDEGGERDACYQGCRFWGQDQCFGGKTERDCDGAFVFAGFGSCFDKDAKRYARTRFPNLPLESCRARCLSADPTHLAGFEWTYVDKSTTKCDCLYSGRSCPTQCNDEEVGPGKGKIMYADIGLLEPPQTTIGTYVGPRCYKFNEKLRMVAWFRSGTFDIGSRTWPNAVQGGTGATLSGNGLIRVSKTRHGAVGAVTALEGTTADKINFGNVIKPEFTICSVTRYTGGTKRRILNGEGVNWLHGQHDGKAGVALYEGWKTKNDGTNVAPVTDWVVMCGTNAESQLKLVNGVDKGTANGGRGGGKLWVNGGLNMPAESSDFAIVEVMVWDRGLTSKEMYGVSDYLMNKFGIM